MVPGFDVNELEPRLRTRGVAAPYVVGSHARGEARLGSDVDLLIDVDPDSRFHLLHLAAIQHACEEALGRPTDVLTRGALDPEVLGAMEREAVQVF